MVIKLYKFSILSEDDREKVEDLWLKEGLRYVTVNSFWEHERAKHNKLKQIFSTYKAQKEVLIVKEKEKYSERAFYDPEYEHLNIVA